MLIFLDIVPFLVQMFEERPYAELADAISAAKPVLPQRDKIYILDKILEVRRARDQLQRGETGKCPDFTSKVLS